MLLQGRVATFSELLEFINPNRPPDDFAEPHTADHLPSGRDFVSHYKVIRNYCERLTTARPGQKRNQGSHCGGSSQGTDYIEYSPYRFGMTLTLPSDEEVAKVAQEAILETSISEAEAVSLGLAPTEMAGGKVLLLSHVPDAKSEEEALQKARSFAHGYEIDRTLFPWGSHALRVADFNHCILPWLEKRPCSGCGYQSAWNFTGVRPAEFVREWQPASDVKQSSRAVALEKPLRKLMDAA
jgi:hypothetical protein